MTSRRSSRSSRSDADAARAGKIGAAVCAVLILPRIVRMLYPEVWVEDDFYLESAWLVSAGMRPYIDFVHPHMPVLEWFAGAYLKLFGASHLKIELLNEAAIYATSILAFALGFRVGGRPTAIASAILYGFASLVFRYHVYERECFVAPIVVGATILALTSGAHASIRTVAAIAAMLALACAIKLTAVIPTAVIIAYVAIAERRIANAIAIGLGFSALLIALSALCYWLYGWEFIFQTFFFHFMKGRDTMRSIALYPAAVLDILVPLFVLGAIRIITNRPISRAAALVLAIVAAEYLFFGVLSPTAWAHNYLEALPFIAIVAAVGAIQSIDALLAVVTAPEPDRIEWYRLIGGGALILIGLLWATPLINENWLHGGVYGFGYLQRDELAQIAAAVDHQCRPGDTIIAPAFIAFEANRIELIRYPETYGVWREAKSEYERDGFFAARSHLGRVDFFQLIADTAHYWTELIKDAITVHKVKVVISDSPVQLLPLVGIPPAILAANGYRPVLRTEHYSVWVLSGGQSP